MGSDSDLPCMEQAEKVLEELHIPYDRTIVSAHRTPHRMMAVAERARAAGYGCIIAGAGGAAHLPGMTASYTTLPVIGVPVQSKTMSGLDSLYSIVQMPPGIPVGTMAINGAKNAALYAARILSIEDKALEERLEEWVRRMKEEVEEKIRQHTKASN